MDFTCLQRCCFAARRFSACTYIWLDRLRPRYGLPLLVLEPLVELNWSTASFARKVPLSLALEFNYRFTAVWRNCYLPVSERIYCLTQPSLESFPLFLLSLPPFLWRRHPHARHARNPEKRKETETVKRRSPFKYKWRCPAHLFSPVRFPGRQVSANAIGGTRGSRPAFIGHGLAFSRES